MEHVAIETANASPFFLPLDLMAVEAVSLGPKPRQASSAEIVAYAQWLAARAGLATLESANVVHFPSQDRRRGFRGVARGVTFGRPLGGLNYEEGAFSVPLPGRNAHRDRVTLETLDEAGEVVATSTMPLEPKKGGVIWDRDAVRKACGVHGRKCPPIPAAPVAVAAPIGAAPVAEPVHLEIAPCEPEIAPVAPIEASDDLAQPEEGLGARVAALEAMVQALLMERAPAPVSAESATPVRKRSAAHERAIRRAWRERGEARRQREGGAAFRHMFEAEQLATKELRAELAAFKRLLPDSSTPARPADLAQLIDERNAARRKLETLQERTRRAANVHSMAAEALEQMTSRAHRAEAQLRELQRVPRPFMVKPSAVTFAPALAA